MNYMLLRLNKGLFSLRGNTRFYDYNMYIPVSQIVSFNLFPPTVSVLILKSTPTDHRNNISSYRMRAF